MGKKKGAPSAKSARPGDVRSRAMTPAEAAKLCLCAEGEYEGLLAAKVGKVKARLADALPAGLDVRVFASPPSAFRQRCNFQLWHEAPDDGAIHYVMYDPTAEERLPLRVDVFKRGCPETQRLMPLVLDALRDDAVLREKVRECRFHTTLRGGSLVLLAYNRPLDVDPAWKTRAEALAAALGPDVVVVGRSAKVRVAAGGAPRVVETLESGGVATTLTQLEGEFSQPNGRVCEHMVAWALEATAGSGDRDALELYCGNGNFTVPLARNFRRVLATEVSKPNCENARANATANGRDNVKLARLSAAEAAEALKPEGRPFKRLEEAGVKLAEYDLRTLIVDPPRAGLEVAALQLARTFDSIVYVSCNPETLAGDLAQLAHTHAVERAAVFDQFPYTDHCECGVLLAKKPGVDLATAPPIVARETVRSERYEKVHARRDAQKQRKAEKKKAKRERREALEAAAAAADEDREAGAEEASEAKRPRTEGGDGASGGGWMSKLLGKWGGS